MALTDFSPELNVYLVPFFKGRVLILKRKSGFWEFPGGSVEFGEHPEKAAVRETEEESGLRVSNLVLLGITSATYPKDGAEKHSVYIVYRGEAAAEDFKLSSEHDDGRWVNLTELEFVKLALNAQDIPDFLKHSK
ncbi:ADP-ribose pyrophosphatase [uncultured archaeon]|nr:ADP-ribose pyrophosphatase [uncultured archaeon]